MNLSDFSLTRPVAAIVMSILIVLFGAVGYTFLGVREYPAIDPPSITVRTAYTGANADIVESQITEPLEKAINGIEGIKSISSSSSLGSSNITVEFELGADLERAANDVRDKVGQAQRNLPQDIDAPPVVTKADANSDPVIFMPVQSSTMNIVELSDYADKVLLEKVQSIPGVSLVNIYGARKPAMRLWMDPVKLAAYNLTVADVNAALNRENVDLPSGKVRGDATELTVKTFGRLETEEDFNNMILRQTDGQIVRFKDVGEAVLGAENEETSLRVNGVNCVSLALIPQPGANLIDISDAFYKRFDEIQKNAPEGLSLVVGRDKSVYIRKSVTEVVETLAIAIGLVVLIIYLFFRNWAIAFRPLVDIPVSLVGTFFIMYSLDFSINILTLLGIVLATGLVVDDGIVVTENIFRKMEQGMDKWTAAREGTREIFFAVISTSLTLAVVFIPVIFLQGFTGRLFREFGIVVAGAVLISAFVSLTLTPVLNVKMGGSSNKNNRFYQFTEPFFRGMENLYRRSLQGFMRVRWLAIVMLLVCMGLIYGIGGTLKTELAPLEDRSAIRSPITAPEGTDYDYMEKMVGDYTQVVMDSVPEHKLVFAVTAPGFSGTGSTNSGFLNVILKEPDERKATQKEIYERLGKMYKNMTEARIFPNQEQTISTSFGSSMQLPVQFVLQNLNFQKLEAVVPKFLDEARKDPTFGNVDVNLKFNKPELQININRLKATEMGVSVLEVSNILQLALSGRRFGYFLRDGKQYQVIGQLERGNRDEPLDLASIYIRNNKGQMVQLDNIVTMEETSNPPQLFHHNRYKSATISASLAPGKTLGEGIDAMNKIADRLLDETFQRDLAGASRDFAESSSNTSFAFILALLLVYLILAAQFESFTDPLIIMLTVPLALAGAYLSLWLFDQTLNIFSQIGMIMLIGLVTKNGILIVEFANHIRESGKTKMEAIIEASAERLRPILMTSLATILGALPIALALGAGAQSRIPLGIVIVGGLVFSLILTLYVIPAMYAIFGRKRNTPFGSEQTNPHNKDNSEKETNAETETISAPNVLTVIVLLFAFVGVSVGTVAAQGLLTPDEAVQIGLKNNFDIQIARANAEVSNANNTAGNAGMLPTVSANIGDNLSINNTQLKFADGSLRQASGALSNTFTANVALNWTVFDGMKMFITREKLSKQAELGEIQLKEQIVNSTAAIVLTYFEIVRQKQQLKAVRDLIAYNQERVKISEARFTTGVTAKTDFLQAKIDLNVYRENEITQKNAVNNAKRNLNKLLSRNLETDFDVTDEIPLSLTVNLETLASRLETSNFSILQAKQQITISELTIRETKSLYLPRVGVNAGLYFNRSDNAVGVTLFNQNTGPQFGFNISVPIYQGGNVKRQVKVAELQLKSAEYALERIRFETRTQLKNALADYQTQNELLSIEKENLSLAKEYLDLALARLRLGQTNALEVSQAQLNYENARTRFNTFQYNLKVAETKLFQLAAVGL